MYYMEPWTASPVPDIAMDQWETPLSLFLSRLPLIQLVITSGLIQQIKRCVVVSFSGVESVALGCNSSQV